MTQTLETGKKTTLSKVLNPADTVMDVATAPTVTKGRAYLFNGQQEERCSYNGIIGNQLQNVVRNLSTTAIPATAGTGLKWIAGTRVKFVAMHDQLVDRGEDIDFVGDIAFNGDVAANLTFKPPRFASIAARNAAIPTPLDGMMCVTEGNLEHYNGTTLQWETADTGTPTPNASPTAAGVVEAPTTPQQVAGTTTGETGALLFSTPDYVKTVNDNAVAEALKIKSKVDVASATTANITLSGTQTIDGVAVTAGQRVLVKNQTAGAENGIYLCAAGSWTRVTDFDANANNEVDLGANVWVQGGTVGAGTQWALTTTGAITVGTTALTFARTYPQSLVGCKATQSTGTSITLGAFGTVGFDAEAFDTHVFHDNSTNNSRITIPAGQAGIYEFVGQVGGSANYTGIKIRKNGSTVIAEQYLGDTGSYTGANTPTTLNVTGIDTAVATDYYELQVYCKTSNTTTTIGSTFFYAKKVG